MPSGEVRPVDQPPWAGRDPLWLHSSPVAPHFAWLGFKPRDLGVNETEAADGRYLTHTRPPAPVQDVRDGAWSLDMPNIFESIVPRTAFGAHRMSEPLMADLTGRRVLVVEDEALVAMLLEDMLGDLGCEVLGPVMRIRDALAMVAQADARIDVAILDVNVAGERSFSVAEALRAKGTPFVMSTGYDEGGIDEPWRGGPILRKPFLSGDLERVLRDALGGRRR
jgi:CheY-like chemotaxis protein